MLPPTHRTDHCLPPKPPPRAKRQVREVPPGKVGPRTKIGSREIRLGDIVLVLDPHHPAPFLGQVVDAYTLGGKWVLLLGVLPHTHGRLPRQSTKITNVKQHWRRDGRAWKP